MDWNKSMLSIDSDDDNENYDGFEEFLNDNTERMKKRDAREFEILGDQYLKELERKKKTKKLKGSKLIPYILDNCDERYTLEELESYGFEDIQQIYNELRKEKRPVIVKFFHFIFNINN